MHLSPAVLWRLFTLILRGSRLIFIALMARYCLTRLCLCQLDLYTLLLVLCSCRTFMIYYRRNRVKTCFSTLIGFHCFISGIEFSLAIAYWLLLPYLGSHCLVLVALLSRLLFPHLAFIATILIVLLSSPNISYERVWL